MVPADASEINRLVALASTTKIDLAYLRRKPINDMRVTFLPGPALESQERAAKILDSLAAILVREPRGGVFAVGARITHNTDASMGKTELFIAGNKNISSTLKAYVEDVWAVLQKMAKENQQSLPPRTRIQKQNYLEVTPPKPNSTNPSLLSNAHRELMVKIYLHCFAKWKHHLQKLGPALTDFFDTFYEHVEPNMNQNTLEQGTDESETFVSIDGIYKDVTWIMEHLPSIKGKGQCQQDYLQKFIGGNEFLGCMYRITVTVRFLSDRGLNRLDAWDKVGKEDAQNRKPLSHIICKFVALHSATEELARFTRSSRHYRVLEKGDFKVVCLKAAAYTFNVPKSETEWSLILKNALQSFEYEREEESEHFIRQAAEGHQNKTGKKHYLVHCECRLLQHFSSEDFALPHLRPVSYIGVSKLSCPACAAVFDAWNQVSNYQYKYRGSHGKCYSPWAVPEKWGCQVNDTSLFNTIYDKVRHLLISTLEQKKYDQAAFE